MKKLVLAFVLMFAGVAAAAADVVSYSRFLEQVREGRVRSVVIRPGRDAAPVVAKLRDGSPVESVLPGDYQPALTLMQERGVNVELAAPSFPWWNALPFGLLVMVWLAMLLTMRKWPKLPWAQ